MKRNSILLALACLGTLSYAQVGINQASPKATLDVSAGQETAKGILIPRLSGNEIKAMEVGNEQISMLVYAVDAATNTDENTTEAIRAKNITEKGFYYWDGAVWQKVIRSAWELRGNANTDESVNFIGTTDDKDLIFKRNMKESGSLTAKNTSYGVSSLPRSSSSSGNSAFGVGALQGNTSGQGNTAMGDSVLNLNTTGVENTGEGNHALNVNKIGSYNSSFGASSLADINQGANNTAVGYNAGRGLVLGDYNTFIGANAFPNIAQNASNQLNIGNVILGYEGNVGIGPAYVPKYDVGFTPGAKPLQRLEVDGGIRSTTINGNVGSVQDKDVVVDGSGVFKVKPAKPANSTGEVNSGEQISLGISTDYVPIVLKKEVVGGDSEADYVFSVENGIWHAKFTIQSTNGRVRYEILWISNR